MTQFSSLSGRRQWAMAGGLAAAAGLVPLRAARASAANAAFQNLVGNGADPTGGDDSAPAFNLAWSRLPATGGTIYVQSGTYLLNSPLVFKDKPVSIVGDGSASTVLLVNHTGWAFSVICDAAAPEAERYPFDIRGFSLAGVAGSPAAGAISVSFGVFANETGYQSCTISDIGIGNSFWNGANGCNFVSGLFLQNIWKSHVENVRMFGNPGGNFITLSSAGGGLCIDNTFLNVFHDGQGTSFGFAYDGMVTVAAPFQGINIISPKFLSGSATSLSTVFNTNLIPSVLGLYLTGGTISSSTRCLDLADVSGGVISNCGFGVYGSSCSAIINIRSCDTLQIADCNFNGPWPACPSAFALSISGALNRISNLIIDNIGQGVQFAPTCVSTLATGLVFRDMTKGNWALGAAAVDQSGTSGSGRNNAQWMDETGNIVSLY